MTKRAVLYARVSTQEQSDNGFSLPFQLAECRKYAAAHGLEVVAEIAEDVSGKVPIRERAQGRLLAAMLARGEADAVIAHQVERLSRDIADLLVIVRDWRQAGVEVHTGDVGQIKSETDIVLVTKAWQGSDEWKKIRERSMRGRRAKSREGRVVGGREPYGYRHTRDEHGKVLNFAIVESEAEIVRQIYEWYTVGDGESGPLAATAIARRLAKLRVPTPGEARPGYNRTRETGMWTPAKILNILSNEVYAGVWWFGVRIGATRQTRPVEERIAVDVPAIVSRATWKAAKAQRARNKKHAKRNAKHDYLLSGIISCACGMAMCGEWSGAKKHRYYSCSWINNHHLGLEERTCRARKVRIDAIEADVWDSLKGVFSDLVQLEELLRRAQQEELAALTPQQAELDTVTTLLAECEQQAADIARAIVKATGVVESALEKEAHAVNMRHAALVKRRDELTAALAQTRLTDEAIRDTVRLAANVRAGLENADFATKRWILELFQVQVTVRNGRFYVSCLAGNWDGEIRLLPGQRGYRKQTDTPPTGGI